MTDAGPMVEFRLFVAGNAPNSRRAIANLTELCQRHLPGRHQVEIIDAFEHPRRALDEGVFLTPHLVIASLSPAVIVVGDLRDPGPILFALGITGVVA